MKGSDSEPRIQEEELIIFTRRQTQGKGMNVPVLSSEMKSPRVSHVPKTSDLSQEKRRHFSPGGPTSPGCAGLAVYVMDFEGYYIFENLWVDIDIRNLKTPLPSKKMLLCSAWNVVGLYDS